MWRFERLVLSKSDRGVDVLCCVTAGAQGPPASDQGVQDVEQVGLMCREMEEAECTSRRRAGHHAHEEVHRSSISAPPAHQRSLQEKGLTQENGGLAEVQLQSSTIDVQGLPLPLPLGLRDAGFIFVDEALPGRRILPQLPPDLISERQYTILHCGTIATIFPRDDATSQRAPGRSKKYGCRRPKQAQRSKRHEQPQKKGVADGQDQGESGSDNKRKEGEDMTRCPVAKTPGQRPCAEACAFTGQGHDCYPLAQYGSEIKNG
ncbi:hypothetical protein BU16DRAFT_591057 [Lophium mytilinum]|uniref:Uncharacterized protein n=1 Tax=Lophium mytilinum TaxID=390894 RepID=A0A6A6QNZ8_9PEZI|nr:hypothetical protein BU16DRAFT_591057 [Lophium mytilinum]